MVIHCTRKLAAKLPMVSTDLLAENSPLGSWLAQATHIAELDRWFKEAFTASLAYMGMADNQVRRAGAGDGAVKK